MSIKLEYKLEESDFLAFQLFTASKSLRISNKRMYGRILIVIITVLLGLYFYQKGNNVMAIYFGVFAVISLLFYPKYFNWRYKNHYKKYIKENYYIRFGKPVIVELNEIHIISIDETGEGKVKISEIVNVDETINHFFLKISNGHTFIIKKDAITRLNDFRNELISFGLSVNNEINWKWN